MQGQPDRILAIETLQFASVSWPAMSANASDEESELVQSILYDSEHDFSLSLVTYVVPLFVVVGLIGNSLTIAVLSRRGVRKSTTIFYLTTLSASDVVSIIIGPPTYWMHVVINLELREMSEIFCKLHPFLVYSTTHFIVWTLVLVTVDRLLWVAAPFKAKGLCTIRNATIALATAAITILAINSHFLWMLSLQAPSANETAFMPSCAASPEYLTFSAYVVPLIDLFIYSLLPFTIMIISNIIIIFKLHYYATKRKATLKKATTSLNSLHPTTNLCRLASSSFNAVSRMQSLQTGDGNCVGVVSSAHANSFSLSQSQSQRLKKPRPSSTRKSHLTTMLLTVNIFFILTTLPITVSNIVYCVFEQEQRANNDWARIIGKFQTVSHLLNYLNITAHFVLYCLSGKAFRDDVLILLRLKKPSPTLKRPLERLTSIQPDYNTCVF